jgi:hypothetical protein
MHEIQGAAKRMEGMTPTSVVSLLRYAKRTPRKSLDVPIFPTTEAGRLSADDSLETTVIGNDKSL